MDKGGEKFLEHKEQVSGRRINPFMLNFFVIIEGKARNLKCLLARIVIRNGVGNKR